MQFADRLVAWQRQHGRHTLPWQKHSPGDAYPIWLSEIMLQQTQVDTVIPYYQRFLEHFPNLAVLADAHQDEVLSHWSGLGYYSRARNLHAAARQITSQHGGQFPHNIEAIQALPGVGRSTAAAISVFAFGHRHAILDGNVKRVLSRVFGIEGWPGHKNIEEQLWKLAETLLPDAEIRAYTQGLMDLGATVCTRNRPRCDCCPFARECIALLQGRQQALPAARPKKTIPTKNTAMLILSCANKVLLEKRPNNGIWGGLWSLPECSPEEDPLQAAHRLGYTVKANVDLPLFVHAFTHFRLLIQPWLLEVWRTPVAEETGKFWISLENLDNTALPTPVRKILFSLNHVETRRNRGHS